MTPRDLLDPLQRRDLARHAVHAVNRDHAMLGGRLFQQPLQGFRAQRVQLFQDRAVGRRDLRRLMDRVMRLAVDDQQVSFGGKGWEQADVGQRDAGEDQRVLDAQPARQAVLGFLAQGDAAESARSAVVQSPPRRGLDQRLLDGRMTVQAEETVRPEVDQLVVADPHLPLVAHIVHTQVLEVDVGQVIQEQQSQPHDPVAAQMVRQASDRVSLCRLGRLGALVLPRPLRGSVRRLLRNHVHLAVHLVSSRLTIHPGPVPPPDPPP